MSDDDDGQDGRVSRHSSRRLLIVDGSAAQSALAELASARAGRVLARMATASSAALVAPALPMASVPTGTPAGICTMESSESTPLQRAALDGHAEHRHGRLRRDHAGQVRRAARARDDDFEPARLGLAANSAISSGVRCAETTRHSCGTPNCFSTSAAWRIVSQSDLLPMMTATRGIRMRRKDEG